MPNVSVQKVKGQEKASLPIFAEIDQRLEEVRRRAHELFCQRNRGADLQLEDWLNAEREIFGWGNTELSEKGNAYELETTLAGFDPKEVKVTATPEEIIVHALAKRPGRGTNEVYRRFELAKPLAFDKVTAKLDKGILHIKAPQVLQVKPPVPIKQVKVAAA